MFRFVWVFYVLFLFSGCSQFTNRKFASTPTACSEGKDIIFLIHGIGGDQTTFGSLDKILKKKLNENENCTEVYPFYYATGNSNLTTKDFAQDFFNFLVEKTEGKVENLDKIALIMHSQGGLIGQLFLSLLRAEKDGRYTYIKRHLDSFITLGTPYWGASAAHFIKNTLFSFPTQDENPISPVGKLELNELEYGSKTTLKLLNDFEKNFNGELNLRPLAVAGYSLRHGKYIGEDDNIVPIYSAMPEHFKVVDFISNYRAGVETKAIQFKHINLIPSLILPALHIKMDRPGLAFFDEVCLQDFDHCDHPSLPVIFGHLKKKEVQKFGDKKDLYRFRINFFLHSKNELNLEELNIKFIKAKAYSGFISEYINSPKKIEGPKNLFQYSFSVNMIADELKDGLAQIFITGKNIKSRSIAAIYRPGTSTFIELNLENKN